MTDSELVALLLTDRECEAALTRVTRGTQAYVDAARRCTLATSCYLQAWAAATPEQHERVRAYLGTSSPRVTSAFAGAHEEVK